MKITDFLKSRQQGLSKNVIVENKTIIFNDIKAKIQLNDWDILDKTILEAFISKFTFPKNEELSKKDKDGIRQNIPNPQILIQKNIDNQSDNSPLIAMYLYNKTQLTGDSLLHVRSINKFEQMWIPYFLNVNQFKRDNPKVHKKEFYEYSQSGEINFIYNLSGQQESNTARLRILSFDFNKYILLMYVFDSNNYKLEPEELDRFIDEIKSST